MNSRRSFVLGAAGAVALMAGKASANSRVRVAVLGVNGRGTDHIRGFNALPNAEVVMLCDPDRNLLAERAEQFETKYHRKVQTEQDLRKVFDNKEIDAVSIATPNHWHALAAIWACQAGKNLSVEKPGAVAVREISRIAELPVPIVAAVCNELRKRDIVDHTRPVRLTDSGRQALGGAGPPELSARCPRCHGHGLVIPAELAGLAAQLEHAAGGAPEAKRELDQTHCTVATKIYRVLRMHEAGALAGKRILLLGDDDLVSVAIAQFTLGTGLAGAPRKITVVDTDPDVLAWAGRQATGTPVPVELV